MRVTPSPIPKFWIMATKHDTTDSKIQACKVKKRNNYLQWDEYFMAVAFLSAKRSKDPNSQVGACIVNEEKKIVGIGYNGMPNGCSDDLLPWARKADDDLDTKYPYGRYFVCPIINTFSCNH